MVTPTPAARAFAREAIAAPAPAALQAHAARLTDWMFEQALPLWWEAGADPRGGFHEQLDLAGRPVWVNRRARVQGRQVFVYATAGALGWTGPWRQAVEHGLAYLAERFERADGLMRATVTPDGAPADETVKLYDQAFVLLGLAAAYRMQPERGELRARALRLMCAVNGALKHPRRGWLEADADHPCQANAQMHLFEAVFAWDGLAPDPAWRAASDELAELALDRLIQPRDGALREFFDAAWSPLAGADGRRIEPGHQFEWAWLLDAWGRARGRPDARAAALRLFELGRRFGVDRAAGVAVNALDDGFQVTDGATRLWPQTEWLKAALVCAPAAEEDAEAGAAAAGLARFFETPTPGLWRDKPDGRGGWLAEPAPASSFYHIACGVAELARAAAERSAAVPDLARRHG